MCDTFSKSKRTPAVKQAFVTVIYVHRKHFLAAGHKIQPKYIARAIANLKFAQNREQEERREKNTNENNEHKTPKAKKVSNTRPRECAPSHF